MVTQSIVNVRNSALEGWSAFQFVGVRSLKRRLFSLYKHRARHSTVKRLVVCKAWAIHDGEQGVDLRTCWQARTALELADGAEKQYG